VNVESRARRKLDSPLNVKSGVAMAAEPATSGKFKAASRRARLSAPAEGAAFAVAVGVGGRSQGAHCTSLAATAARSRRRRVLPSRFVVYRALCTTTTKTADLAI